MSCEQGGFKNKINKMVELIDNSSSLEPGTDLPAKPVSRKSARPVSANTDNGAAGISSPLTEISRVQVNVIDDFTLSVYKITTQLTMEDADGRTVVFNFADPT